MMSRKMIFVSFIGILVYLFLFSTILAGSAAAQQKPWWPVACYEDKDGKITEIQYVPLQEKPSKKWHLVSLIPHIKDVGWVSSNYGIIDEAKRQGVKVTVLEAGGYENLSK
ncbi:MAG: hypothetical protein V1742_06915, partial [Pseudomonadota bacterium]